jgi:hypothetical protein
MSRKRPHGELASSPPTEGAYNPNKSHRATPAVSPAGTTPGTPGSENSLELAERAFAQQHGMYINMNVIQTLSTLLGVYLCRDHTNNLLREQLLGWNVWTQLQSQRPNGEATPGRARGCKTRCRAEGPARKRSSSRKLVAVSWLFSVWL